MGFVRPCEAATTKGLRTMNINSTLSRVIVGALLTGGVAVAGAGLAADTAWAATGSTPLVWQMNDPGDPPPPPEPPPPPPPPQRQCWALFLPAPCPPPR